METKSTLYNEFPLFLKRYFSYKVQKISLNAGFTCPNRDGNKGVGGCTYCNNQTYPRLLPYGEIHYPPAGRRQAVLCTQISGDEVSRLFPGYTNTYGELEDLKRKYEEALSAEGWWAWSSAPVRTVCPTAAGLFGGDEPAYIPFSGVRHREYRRQDTLPHQPRAYFPCRRRCGGKNRFTRNPDRWACHPRTAGRDARKHRAQAGVLSRLPLTTLKMHQLQLIRGTRMALEYRQHPEDFHLFGVDEYIDLVIDYIEHLRPDLVLERFVSQSPKELLIAPDWGLKNYEFNHRVQKRMKELGAYQGKKYEM